MNEVEVLDISREAIFTLIKVVSPVLLVALFIGLIIGIFQALTQIQEMTLAFVPKILGVFSRLSCFFRLCSTKCGCFPTLCLTR